MDEIKNKPSNRDLSALSALLAARSLPAGEAPASAVRAKSARTAANDNKPAREVLAWPALERLAHKGDYRRVYALRHWRNMCYPDRVEVEPDSHEYNPEVVVEVKPSEAALLGAVGWKVDGKERWHFTGEEVNTYERAEPEVAYQTNTNGGKEVTTGKLLFRDGELVQWGRTKKGSALKPSEKARGEKGGSSPGRSEALIWSYLRDIRGAVSPLTARPYCKPMSPEAVIRDALVPQPGTTEAREVLRSFGIDGGVPFDQLPFAAVRCPDGLVAGPQWVSGIKKPKPTGEISAASGREYEAVKTVEMVSHLRLVRKALGAHAKVLDLAVTDASAKDIGVATGLAPAYAEKRGAALVDEAIDALISLDEHARGEWRHVEEKLAA